jgi:NADH:ubiquinone oxidoreductase subunit F (NADH-binding)
MGTTLGEVVYDIGGGVPEGRRFKAVLVGGPSGGCLPEDKLNLPIDYESLTKAGAIMGSGGIVVLDDKSCMVDTAHFFTDFCVDESCGKCVPCRVGLTKARGILAGIMGGEGRVEDLEKLEKLMYLARDVSLCGLGQTAANPILTTLNYFKEEYLKHIVEKKCPAGSSNCFNKQGKVMNTK